MFRHRGKSRTFLHNLKLASLLSFVAGIVNVSGFFAVQTLTTNVTGHFAFFADEVIKAEFNNANARQLQAIYNYERSILNAYLEVSTQLSNIDNLGKRYDLKTRQVDALTRSIDISNNLFSSARADYLEVLMTQRDALESKLELVETKKEQMIAVVNIYRDLGGGWR